MKTRSVDPGAARRAEPPAARGNAAHEALDAYLRDLSALPLLPHAELIAEARRRRAAEAEFTRALAGIPAAAHALLARWRMLRDEGRVTGQLGAGFRDEDGRDWSAHVDAHMQELERRLAGRRSAARDRELERSVLAAELSHETLHAACLALRREPPAAARDRRRLARAEQALAERGEALQRIVSRNLRLVVGIAKRYRSAGVALDDLVQEGNVGLIRAAEKFDPELGYRFSTYAVWWIEQAVMRAVQNQARAIRIPTHLHEERRRIAGARNAHQQSHGREPTFEELGRALGRPVAAIEQAAASAVHVASFAEPIEAGSELTLEDQLEDPGCADPVDEIDALELRGAVARVLDHLPEREKTILAWRFGLAGRPCLTLAQIGARFGLSRERVRQIQAGALERIRDEAGAGTLREALVAGGGR